MKSQMMSKAELEQVLDVAVKEVNDALDLTYFETDKTPYRIKKLDTGKYVVYTSGGWREVEAYLVELEKAAMGLAKANKYLKDIVNRPITYREIWTMFTNKLFRRELK